MDSGAPTGPLTFYQRRQASRANTAGNPAQTTTRSHPAVDTKPTIANPPPAPADVAASMLQVKSPLTDVTNKRSSAVPFTIPVTIQQGTMTENANSTRKRSILPSGGTSEREHRLELQNGELRAELLKKDTEVTFLRKEMSTLRMSNIGVPTAPRGTAITWTPWTRLLTWVLGFMPNGGSATHAYNEALRVAGQDFKACVGCGVPFFSQFRGAPENPNLRVLILKCTKCDEECHRWNV